MTYAEVSLPLVPESTSVMELATLLPLSFSSIQL